MRQGLPAELDAVRAARRAPGAADGRLATLHESGVAEARLYGHDPEDGVGGDGAFFLLLDEPEVYGLPPDPVVATRGLGKTYRYALAAAGAMLTAGISVFLEGRRP